MDRTRETERRRATVLFADISGFTTLNERLDPEQAYDIVTSCLKMLDGIARKHGGSVDKYLGDAVMALFGVPLAMEEAPKAAINAAIEMRNRVYEFNRERGLEWPLDIHSGINTGLMISGDVSGPVLREFAVMGDAVNVAARLKDLAPKGEIWVGGETHRHTQRDFAFTKINAALPLKGKTERIAAYQVESREAHTHRRRLEAGGAIWSRLQERGAELGQLRAALEETVRDGRGGIVTLIADAGLGKSRLLLEAQAAPEAEAVRWVEGRSVAVGEPGGYAPIRDLLTRWLGLENSSGPAARARLDESLAGISLDADAAPFLAAILALPQTPSDRARLRGIEGEALSHLLRKAFTDFVRASATQQPLAVVLEDFHWADETSVDFVESLLPIAQRAPLLLVIASRPAAASTDRILSSAGAERELRRREVTLRPLSPLGAEGLVDGLLAAGDVPHALREAIEARAAGNPLFIEEAVRSLVDDGKLALRDGRLVAAGPVSDVRIPGSLYEVAMARIDRLPQAEKRTLQVASVVGDGAKLPFLRAVSDAGDFDKFIERLVELQFVEVSERGGEATLRFKYPLVREVCYEGILLSTRQQLHLQVAHALEEELSGSAPGEAATLAYHFGRGNDLASAETYLFRAGDEATRVAASSEALAAFREAARLYVERTGDRGDPERRAELEAKIGLAHFRRGQQIEAYEHINRALGHYGVPVPETRPALQRRAAASALVVLAKLYVPALRTGVTRAGERERMIADLLFQRARAQTTTDPLRFVADTLEAMRFFWHVDPRSLHGAAGRNAGGAALFAYSGLFSVSRRLLELAREQLAPADISDAFVVRFFEFTHDLLAGRRGGAVPIERELVEASLRQGELWDVCTYYGILVKRHAYQADFRAAAEVIEALRKIQEQFDYDVARENWQGGAAFLALEQGHWEEAASAAQRYFAENHEVLPNILALATRAKAEILLGQREAARETLTQAERMVEQQATVPPFHLSAVLRSRLLLTACDLEAGASARAFKGHTPAKSVRAALRTVRSVSWRRAEVHRLAARIAFAQRRARAGRALLADALAHAEELAQPAELARAHAEAALQLRAAGGELAGKDAAAHRAASEAGFLALGLEREWTAWLERGL